MTEEALAEVIIAATSAAVAKATALLLKRIDALEAREPVQGPQGPQGEPGPAGADGQTVVGERGLQGEKGLDGVAGRDGLPGVQGPAGDRGEKGMDGKDGRDGIDGTLEGLLVQQFGERGVQFIRDTGEVIGTVTLPVPLYRGVYAAGTAYVKGDAVTFGGSLWVATDATAEKPGAGETAWRLAVKAGRDGREGKAGPVGPVGSKGERGEPGRDYR